MKNFKSNENGLNGVDTTNMQIMKNANGNVIMVIYNAKPYSTSNMGACQLHDLLVSLKNNTCTIQPKARLNAEQKEFVKQACPEVLEKHEKAIKERKNEQAKYYQRKMASIVGIDGDLTEEEKEIVKRRAKLEKDYNEQIRYSKSIDKNLHDLVRYMQVNEYTKHDIIEELNMDYMGNIKMMASDYALNVLEGVTTGQVEYQLRGLLEV